MGSMKNNLWLFVVLSISGVTCAQQDLIPVTQENEYRCKADTLKYYDDYRQLAKRLPFGELSNRAFRLNDCVWLFNELIVNAHGQSTAELDVILAKADAVETVYQAAMSARLTAYLAQIGKYEAFIEQDAAGHRETQTGK
jgi:hypothetical protein